MRPLLERLSEDKPLVADGAMGTMLLERGLEPGQCPEAVNLTRSRVLEEIAAAYLDAGAEMIQTNTFGGSPLKLARHGLEDDMATVNRAAVQAARTAAGDRAYVAGSCGPSGRILKPYGDIDPDEVYDSFRRQLEVLIDAGVDCVCVETMVDLVEASTAVRAAKAVSPTMPVTASMTFDPTPKGFHTVMGVTVEAAATGLREAGADLVGSNCGNGIENMVAIARVFAASSGLPIIIRSNAGLPEMHGGETVYPETPSFMAERAQELVAAGVRVIGGCCGTTPEHIRALRESIAS
jgi:5-methyltetrahydrofolate--homocysteine methyltransferase